MTDQEWLEKLETPGAEYVPALDGPHPTEDDYPREALAAERWGLHPHEARPRSGNTFLHERARFLRWSAQREEYIQTLSLGIRELLEKACVLIDGCQGWYFGCRYCGGLGPRVSVKSDANEEHIAHKPDCVAVRMRNLVTSWITKL